MNSPDFLASVFSDCSDEDTLLCAFRGLIASEISMKRQKLGLSQKEFADLMDVSQGLVSRWESGDSNFTLESLVKISLKLGIEMQSPFKPTSPKVPYVVSGKTVDLSTRWHANTYSGSESFSTELLEM